MTGVFVELLLRRLRGRLWRWLRLLKQPRYLIGTLLGLVYFAWLFRPRGDRKVDVTGLTELLERLADPLQAAAALALAATVSVLWIWLPSTPRLPLDETEIVTLMAAPLRRRQVLRYAVLKSQLGIVLTVLLLFLLTGGSPERLRLMPAYWLLLTLMDLHLKAVALTKARLAELPRRRRRWLYGVGAAVLAAFWTSVALALGEVWPAIARFYREGGGLAGLRPALDAFGTSFDGGPAAILAAPFLWLTSLFIVDGHTTPGAWVGALVLLVAHDRWVVSSPARFEEAALGRARQRAEKKRRLYRIGAPRIPIHQRRRVVFELAPVGAPEVAVYWKNLLRAGRFDLRRLALLGLLVPALVAVAAAVLGFPPQVLPSLCLFGGGGLYAMMVVFGGFLFRNDFRGDLRYVEILKSWPVRGWQLAMAEVATPVTQAGWMALLGVVVVAAGGVGTFVARRIDPAADAGFELPSLLVLAALGLALMPLLLAMAAFASAFQNLIAMLFPAFAALAAQQGQRGPAATGQALIIGIGHLLAMTAAAILPSLAVGMVLGGQLLLGWSLTLWELPLLGLVAAVLMTAEALALLAWVGRLWDRLDPSDELLEG